MDDKLNLVAKLIELKRENTAKELSIAVKNREWSRVPGLDGIEIGLIIAAKIVKEEKCRLKIH